MSSDQDSYEQLLAPISGEDFRAKHRFQGPLHIKGPSAFRESLFSWDELNVLLESHRLESPRVRLEGQGFEGSRILQPSVSPRSVIVNRLDSVALHGYLDEGATLVFDDIGEASPTLHAIVGGLREALGTPVQVNLYATLRPKAGFGLHWDDHDVMAVQLRGTKRWTVYEPVRPWPLFRDFHEDIEQPSVVAWEGVLEPGDLLYLPRGWWHNVIAGDEASLHLTIGIRQRTVIDLIQYVVDELTENEVFREDLQIDDATRLAAQIEKAADLLATRLNSESAHQFVIDRLIGGQFVRPLANIPHAVRPDWDEQSVFEMPGSADVAVTLEEDQLLVRRGSKVVRLSSRAKPIVDALQSRPTTRRDLGAAAASLGAASIDAMLQTLVAESMVSVRTGR